MEPKEPKDPEGDVLSLDDARKKADEKAEREEVVFEKTFEKHVNVDKTINLNGGEFLKPVMAAIARELASVADPDGVVRVGGNDEASRAKTAAVVKGLGIGLGQALAEAFGKYAQKIETGEAQPPVTGTISTEPDDDEDPTKKKPS
ncbi:MAG: hypothetical protein JWM53_177 [bacterium]|nr:hypothetical protein [bacterium]